MKTPSVPTGCAMNVPGTVVLKHQFLDASNDSVLQGDDLL